MVADDIPVLYHCKENSPDELARIRIKFTGEVTLTGKLDVTVDEEFGYQVYFIVDSESINNENLKELLGEESFSRDCEITIKDFSIHYAATEATNTAELISVSYIE